MLPDCRCNEPDYQVPQFNVVADEIEGFYERLKGFKEYFHPCFQRSESRENFLRYLSGQLSEVDRKSIEPMAMQVDGATIRGLQRFISNSKWDEAQMLDIYHGLINEDLGDKHGALLFDESGFLKKGNDSAGVARQYCGTAGKVDNCQVGVFCAYVSSYGYSLLDKRLYVPKEWFSKDFEERRSKCEMPEDLQFKTKPQLAAEMFREIASKETLPFSYVVSDSLYGNSSEFVDALAERDEFTYFLSVHKDTRCWTSQPRVREKHYTYRGETKTKTVLDKKQPRPVRVDELARQINPYQWYRFKVSEGTKGPIVYEFAKKRVVLSNHGLPSRRVWLIIKRTVSDEPEYSFYISNAQKSTRLRTFAWLSGLRWAIEQCFEEAKSIVGMDQYEVRKFRAWHHHMLVCMLAHFFLWHLKIAMGKKSTSYYGLAA